MVYSNQRYTHNNTIQATLPLQAIPSQKAIQAIQPQKAIQPIYGARSVEAQKRTYNKVRTQTKNFLANYNDPTELNSYIDALTNREAVSKEFGDVWGTVSTMSGQVSVLASVAALALEAIAWIASAALPDASAIGAAGSAAAAGIRGAKIASGAAKAAKVAKTVAKVAAIPSIPAAAKVTYDYGLKPIAAGKPKEALLNTLMNLGESADYMANPVKGLIIEGPEGFAKASGFTDAGRVNYDYDTGFVLTDMLLEVISDPLNWYELGSTRALSKQARAKADTISAQITSTIFETTEDYAPWLVEELSPYGRKMFTDKINQATKDIVNRTARASAEKMSEAAKSAFLKNAKAQLETAVARALKDVFPRASSEEIMYIMRSTSRKYLGDAAVKGAIDQIADLTFDNMTTNVIRNLARMTKYSDELQKSMTKKALLTSGYGLGIEAVKHMKPLLQWSNNFVFRHLSKSPQIFDYKRGLNIRQWEEAKNIWEASYKYTYDLSDGLVQRDQNAFYAFASAQFNRDREIITNVLQDGTDYLQKSARISACINDLYDMDFNEYVEYLRKINVIEGGIYTDYITYLDSIKNTLEKQALTVPAGAHIKTVKSMFPEKDLGIVGTLTKPQNEIIKELKEAATVIDKKVRLKDKMYTIKMNNAFVNAQLLQDKEIAQVLEEIASSERLGAFLNKIIPDLEARKNVELLEAAKIVKRAGQSFQNIKQLYVAVANMPLPPIKGVNDTAFRRYVLDQIFGLQQTASELLAEFDSITMPSLKNGLELLLHDTGFKFKDYPDLENQIAAALKQYLAAQHTAGVEHIGAVVVQDFTKSVKDLLRELPEFAQDFAHLAKANNHIEIVMSRIRDTNNALLTALCTTEKTIFSVATDRKLVDYGLARNTVIAEKTLDLFNLKQNTPGNIVKAAQEMGHRIQHLVQRLKQYSSYFNKDTAWAIRDVYKHFMQLYHYKSPFPRKLGLPAFSYLKYSKDTYEQFATLVEFVKAARTNLDTSDFEVCIANVFKEHDATYKLYNSVLHPESLLVTDFAWDAMAQSAWIAEKQLNENIINSIHAYRNLSILPKKIINDFQEIRKVLSTNKLDRPKMLQQERYIKAASKINDELEFLEKHYASLFDHELAEKQITRLYDMCTKHPRFKEHLPTIEKLKQYWRGELTFEQTPKYMRGLTNNVDTFTPFWNEVKKMNRMYMEIRRSEMIQEHLTKVLPKDIAHRWFIEEPARGEMILNILNDASYDLDVPEVFEMYKYFLSLLDLDVNAEIPWEYLPAKFKEVQFKYYHDILGVEDPSMVYAYIEENVGGYHTVGTKNVVAVLRNAKSLEDLARVYNHEAAHNILDSIFNTARTNTYHNAYAPGHMAFLDTFKKRFEERFGVETTNHVLKVLAGVYAKVDVNLAPLRELLDDTKYYTVLEELFTMSVGDNLLDLGYFKHFGTPPAQDALTEWSNELIEELKGLVEEHDLVKKLPSYDFIYQAKTKLKFNVDYDVVTPWDPVRKQQELNKAINKASDRNALGALYNFFNLSTEDIVTELAYRHRFITFHKSDLVDPKLSGMFKKFRNSLPENVKCIEDNMGRFWVVLTDKNLKMQGRQVFLNNVRLMRKAKPKRFNEFMLVDELIDNADNPGLTDTLNSLDDSLETLTGSRLGDSQGEFLSKEMLENIYTEMPEEVQKLLPKLDVWLDKQFFDAYHFNESILGTASSKAKLGMRSGNMVVNMRNAIVQAEGYLKPRNEYVNTVFDSQLSIASPNSVWQHFSDQELLEALQANPDYSLVCLVNDKKYGMKTREIRPLSVKDIQKAKELGAVIIPLQTYKDMYNVVNHRVGSTGLAKIWSRIMYLYKFGYLCRPGAWIRNFIDTNLKTYLETGDDFALYNTKAHAILADVKEMQEYIKARQKWYADIKARSNNYKAAATQILNDVDKMNDFIQLRSQGGVIPSQEIKKWFDEGHFKSLSYEQYLELERDFLSQGISGNVMNELYAGEGGSVWRAITHLTGKIVDTFNKTEEYNRLATFLYERDKGLDLTQSLLKIDKIHFDYSFKTKFEQLVDLVFPFTTFSLRNYSYWAEMLEKHPWIMRNYVHLMKPSWDFQDYTPEELARDQRVQAQILYGQLKLGEFKDKVITFKANPSVQDAIQMFTDPINNVYEKLAAPFSALIDTAKGETVNYNNLIPVIGPMIQSIQTMSKTGTPMPSAIGVSKTPRRTGRVKFTNKNLSKVNSYRDKYSRIPRYHKNYYPDPYRTIGVKQFRNNLYPVIDIAHDIKMRYSNDIYNRVKAKARTDVYKGIQYRIRVDFNKFR